MSESDYMDICEQLSRELWLAGQEIEKLRRVTGIKIPTDSMEQEIQAHIRRATAKHKEAYDALWQEKELLLSVLKDWQEFAKDSVVTVGEREFDKLGYLERRTQEVLKP